jgi:hypothetical protein
MDYGNITMARSTGNSSFFSRRITLPIITTVQETLRCQNVDIQPVAKVKDAFPARSSTSPGQSQSSRTPSNRILPRHQNSFRHDRTSHNHLQDAFSEVRDQPDMCLASVLFTNPSDQALEVCLERRQEGEGKSRFRSLVLG